MTFRAWGPVAGWAAVLFFLSSLQPSHDLPWLPVNDKVAHLCLYGVLGFTLARARVLGGTAWPHAAFMLAGVLYGVTDEVHQAFVPGRTPSVLDWLADTSGVMLGYTIFLTTIRKRDGRPDGAEDPGAGNEGT